MKSVIETVKKSERIAFTELELEAMGFGSAKTLKRNRYEGTGLPYVKIGRRVRYLKTDLLRFLHANRVVPE